MSINFDLYTVEDKYINTGRWSPITRTYSPGPGPVSSTASTRASSDTCNAAISQQFCRHKYPTHLHTLRPEQGDYIPARLLDISTRGKRNVDGVLSPRQRGCEADTAVRSATVNK